MKPLSILFFLLSFISISAICQSSLILPDSIIEVLGQEPIPINLSEVKQAIGYPPKAISSRIEGEVVICVQLDSSGNYQSHSLENPESAPPLLADACQREIHKLRFIPAKDTLGNVFENFYVNIPFYFALENPGQDLLEVGIKLFQEGQWKSARKKITQVLKNDKSNYPAFMLMGLIYYQLGENKYAKLGFSRAIRAYQDLSKNSSHKIEKLMDQHLVLLEIVDGIPGILSEEEVGPTLNELVGLLEPF